MFEKNQECNQENNLVAERPIKDFPIIDEITKKLISDFSPEEQRMILFKVKENVSQYYEQLRQEHLKNAEHFSKMMDVFNG